MSKWSMPTWTIALCSQNLEPPLPPKSKKPWFCTKKLRPQTKMGLKSMTLKSRAVCSTKWASQVAVKVPYLRYLSSTPISLLLFFESAHIRTYMHVSKRRAGWGGQRIQKRLKHWQQRAPSGVQTHVLNWPSHQVPLSDFKLMTS